MNTTGGTSTSVHPGLKKIRQPDTFRVLATDGRNMVLKWLQLSHRGTRLIFRTLLLKPVEVVDVDSCNKFAKEKVNLKSYASAWFTLSLALLRHLGKTLWYWVRVLLWLWRGLTNPPQQVGPESKYRKRSTGLSITPLEVIVFASVCFLLSSFVKILLQ